MNNGAREAGKFLLGKFVRTSSLLILLSKYTVYKTKLHFREHSHGLNTKRL